MTIALNGVRKALENNWLPVVNYDREVHDYFYDPDRGPNVWEYSFEPVMGVSYARVEDLLERGEISPSDPHSYPPELIWEWHRFDPERIATFRARRWLLLFGMRLGKLRTSSETFVPDKQDGP
jgi:hypothetical protein